MTITTADITDAEQLVEQRKREYLERFGWEYTHQTPGGFGLWRRDFSAKGFGVMCVPLSIAIQMTRSVLDSEFYDA